MKKTRTTQETSRQTKKTCMRWFETDEKQEGSILVHPSYSTTTDYYQATCHFPKPHAMTKMLQPTRSCTRIPLRSEDQCHFLATGMASKQEQSTATTTTTSLIITSAPADSIRHRSGCSSFIRGDAIGVSSGSGDAVEAAQATHPEAPRRPLLQSRKTA
jgi:hypothetical protein